VKLSEIIREKGFGYVSDAELADTLLFVWKSYPMPYKDFMKLPLPTYFEMVHFLEEAAKEEKRAYEKVRRKG